MITTEGGDYDLHGDDLCVPSPGRNKTSSAPTRDSGTSSGSMQNQQRIASSPSSLNNSALLAMEDTEDLREQPGAGQIDPSASSNADCTDNPLASCLDAAPSLLGDSNGQYIMGTALDALVVAPSALLSGKKNGIATNGVSSPNSHESIRPTVATSDFVVQFPADQVTDRIMAFLVTSTRTSLVGGMLNGHQVDDGAAVNADILPTASSSTPSKLKVAAKRSSRKLIRSLSNATGGSGDAVPRGPSVQFWLNGCRIPDLEMTYANFQDSSPNDTSGSNGKTQCRFRNGNSTRPSSDTMERLIQEDKLREGVNTVEFRLVLPIGGNGGVIVETQDVDGHAKNTVDGGVHLVGGVVIAIAPALLHMWSSADSVIVSDIDGTVTKSDVRGVLDTVVTERFEYVHRGVCDLYQKLHSINIADEEASFGGKSDGDGDNGNDATDGGQVRFLYLSSRPLSLVNSTRRFLTCLVQGTNSAGNQMRRRMLPPGPLFCHPGSLSTVLLTELWNKNTHQFKADVLARQVVLPFAAAGRDCYTADDDANNSEEKKSSVSSRPGKKRKLFLAGFGNKAMDAAAYEMAGIEKKDIYIINKESFLVCMDGDDEIDVSNNARSPSISFGSGSTRQLLRKSVRRVKSAGSFRVSQGDGSNASSVRAKEQAISNDGRSAPLSGDESALVASAPTSLNGTHHTIHEEDDDCDMISGQLSATVESMLCGATDGVCCGNGGDDLDGACDKEDYSASMTFGADSNYLGTAQTESSGGGVGVDNVRSAPPSPLAESIGGPPRPPSLRHSVTSPLARQISTLSSKSSYRRNKGKTFTGYDDHQLFESIRWKLFMDS